MLKLITFYVGYNVVINGIQWERQSDKQQCNKKFGTQKHGWWLFNVSTSHYFIRHMKNIIFWGWMIREWAKTKTMKKPWQIQLLMLLLPCLVLSSFIRVFSLVQHKTNCVPRENEAQCIYCIALIQTLDFEKYHDLASQRIIISIERFSCIRIRIM